MIGKTVSHYRILEKLGEGGMGIVYKARDTKLKRTVALKFLPPELTRDKEAKERFIHEAQAASALQHNNVSTIHEIDETDDGRLYICMDYYDGETLRERIQSGTIQFEEIVKIAIQIAQGIQEAHAKGIIHRDIKSANIIITSHGQVKIMDFGLAKLTGKAGPTKTGMTPGTIAYMSPEQTRGEVVDGRTDIWSLGIVLYEMITGQLPFKGDYEQAVIYSILNENPEPIGQFRHHVPADLVMIIEKCLEKKKDDRYQTADEVLDELEIVKNEIFIPKIKSDKYLRFLWAKSRRFSSRTWQFITYVLILFILIIVVLFNSPSLKERLGLISIPSVKHLAVLPFNNIGNLPINQVYCDGFAEILTSKLTQLEEFQGELWVVPSSEIRRQEIVSVQEAKQKFEVNLVVTGSVQRDNDSILMTLNLVDAESLRQLRSTVIDDQITNIAMMQNGILNKLTDMLKIELKPEKLETLKIGTTSHPLAFNDYIQGRGYLQDYQDAEKIDSAIVLFRRALEKDGNYGLAHAGLGEAYLLKYQLTKNVQYMESASFHCDRSLNLDSKLNPVRITLGLIHSEKGQYTEAAEVFLEAIQIDQMNADAYRNLASVYESMGQLDEAEETYQKAIQLKPSYWGGFSKLGAFYFRHGHYMDAVAQFRQVISLTPENAIAYSNLGGILFSLGQMEDAREMFEESIRIKPSYRAYYNLATLHFYQQNYIEAAEMYENTLSISDDDYRVWGALAASYYWTKGKRDLATEKYRRAISLAEGQLQINPQDPYLLADLAGYHASLGNQPKSLSLLNRVIALKSSNLEDMFRIAEIYQQLGESEQAIKWLEIVLEKGYGLVQIQKNPVFKDLYSDYRFKKLLEIYSQDSSRVKK